MKRSASKITPKIVDVLKTIADLGSVLPHALEREILNRAGRRATWHKGKALSERASEKVTV